MLTGKSQDKLRLNPRKAWYRNLDDVVPEGDHAVTFVLKRPQPAFPMLLASDFPGLSVPCPAARYAHSSDRHRPLQIRRVQAERVHQAGTNEDYWKPGRPYLDGIEWTISRTGRPRPWPLSPASST